MLKKHIRKLRISGAITTDPFDILSEQKLFYQKLCTSENKSVDHLLTIESFLSDLNIPSITDEQKLSCEGKITPEECSTLLGSFQKTKRQVVTASRLNFVKSFVH